MIENILYQFHHSSINYLFNQLQHKDGKFTQEHEQGDGRNPFDSLKTITLSPNENMVKAVRAEHSRLRNIVVFFVCLDANAFHSHKFLDDRLNSMWGKKIGLHVDFCRMIQRGLFIIF